MSFPGTLVSSFPAASPCVLLCPPLFGPRRSKSKIVLGDHQSRSIQGTNRAKSTMVFLRTRFIKGVMTQDQGQRNVIDVDADEEHEELQNQVFELNEIEKRIGAIKEKLQAIDDGNTSISAYDTAWVAMVKDMNGSDAPQFPSSLQWIIKNQLPDGSWGDRNFFSSYDRLLCTLACIIALKSWNICPENCKKGMSFFEQNLHKLKDEDPLHMLVGFEVTLPGLVEMAQNMEIEGPWDSPVLQDFYNIRDQKLQRIPMEILHSRPTALLFSLEGFSSLSGLEWEKLLKLQHKNGSFLCSPSSTAFALMRTKDKKCLEYLKNLVQKFNGGVPHSYPKDLFERIWAIDRLERLGISRYFKSQIKECLNYVYSHWTPKGISWTRENTSVPDVDDTSMGFRFLRLYGYDVNTDAFEHYKKGGEFFCYVGQLSQGVTDMFSLHKASQVLFPGEKILEEANEFTTKFLKKRLSTGKMADKWLVSKDLALEVQTVLEVPYHAMLPRIESRYYIDQYAGDSDAWIGKVTYRMYNICSDLYLELAKLDYNHCQKLHQLEWVDIQRWYDDCNLSKFGLSKDGLLQAYFVAMSSISEPEKATQRLAWARTMALMEAAVLYFRNEANTPEQRSLLLESFRANIIANNINGGLSSMNLRDGLVKAILKTLSIISSEVQRLHGKEVQQCLKNAWESWLLEWQTQEDMQGIPKEEANLLVNTINLCRDAFFSEDLMFQPAYIHLSNLTNKLCYNLRRIKDLKGGKEENSCGETGIKLQTDTVELQMQELLQHVVQSHENSATVGSEVKQAFMAVARSFYYTTFIESKTIEAHIDMVLFDRVL